MTTYQLFVSEEEGGTLIPIDQAVIDRSPALRSIVDRSIVRASARGDNDIAYGQSYTQKPGHDNVHDQNTPGPHSRSYSKQLA